MGDHDALTRLVWILLDNADKHGSEPIDVTLETGDTTATLTVTDHGPGIAPEHIDHVFERFYRADPARSPAGGSAGATAAFTGSAFFARSSARWGAGESSLIASGRFRSWCTSASSPCTALRYLRAVRLLRAIEIDESAAINAAPTPKLAASAPRAARSGSASR